MPQNTPSPPAGRHDLAELARQLIGAEYRLSQRRARRSRAGLGRLWSRLSAVFRRGAGRPAEAPYETRGVSAYAVPGPERFTGQVWSTPGGRGQPGQPGQWRGTGGPADRTAGAAGATGRPGDNRGGALTGTDNPRGRRPEDGRGEDPAATVDRVKSVVSRLSGPERRAFEDAVLGALRNDTKWVKAYNSSPAAMPLAAKYANDAYEREVAPCSAGRTRGSLSRRARPWGTPVGWSGSAWNRCRRPGRGSSVRLPGRTSRHRTARPQPPDRGRTTATASSPRRTWRGARRRPTCGTPADRKP
ncbi:hypothetical protein SHKM778_83500 [Streptomyces sp. KM77-8]|uniref:Uncharacterized protein n=1 Tax=Streptomyces haneummycinicus TaxID=3074435 RepID=A0AAT9HWA4_9ACTN